MAEQKCPDCGKECLFSAKTQQKKSTYMLFYCTNPDCPTLTVKSIMEACSKESKANIVATLLTGMPALKDKLKGVTG